jgi:outer membrane lipoprotein SlyB
MRMTGIRAAALAVMGATALIACTPQQNANVMPANQALTASTVSFGTVTSSRAVQLQGGQGSQAAGAVLGGLAGAALGQEVGGGTGKVVATGVGATAGAAAGLQAGRSIAGRPSIEWTVRMDNGSSIAVVQGEPMFSIGQRVQVITGGGQTRLAPA